MLTFAISCLTISSLPCFMDLTFQVPMQYCSLQHLTLLSPPDTTRTGHHFRFGSHSSFFLQLYLCSTPNIILGTYRPLGLLFQCHIFLPSHTVHGVLKARILSSLPFHSQVDHILLALTGRNMPFSHSSQLDDMPGAQAFLLLLLIECLNLHWLSAVSQGQILILCII